MVTSRAVAPQHRGNLNGQPECMASRLGLGPYMAQVRVPAPATDHHPGRVRARAHHTGRLGELELDETRHMRLGK